MALRIRKISCHKVIVQLTNNDLDQLDLDLINKPQENIHKFLFDVMKEVEIQTGFDPYHGGQVIVEATPSDTGMDLVISKIPTRNRKMTREEFRKIKSIKVKEPQKIKKAEHRMVFVFNTYEDFENAVVRMDNDSLLCMTLYRNESKYALISGGEINQNTKNIICEYSSRWGKYSPLHCHIVESWQEVHSGESLIEMAENIKGIL